MKSVLLLVLFLGLVSGLWYKRNFDRREETPTEEPDTTTTAEEETETTTEAEYTTTDETTTEGSAALASDMGPNCEEFAGLSDEAALEAHCGEDDDCLKSAEDCELRLKCEAFGEIENCGGFGNLEDRVRRLEKLFKKSTELLIRMMLGGGRGAASEGGLGAGINPYRRDRIYNLLVRIEKELKNKN